MKVEKVDINKLKPYPDNPREITDDQLGRLEKSIREFGYIDPIIVNSYNMTVVGGNQRYRVLKDMGFKEVDVVFISEADEDREKALNTALNKLGGDWDIDKLQNIVTDLRIDPVTLNLTGFTPLELFEIDMHGDIKDSTARQKNREDTDKSTTSLEKRLDELYVPSDYQQNKNDEDKTTTTSNNNIINDYNNPNNKSIITCPKCGYEIRK